MVEELKNWNLLVKLSLTQNESKIPIVKNVTVSDYTTLQDEAKQLGN